MHSSLRHLSYGGRFEGRKIGKYRDCVKMHVCNCRRKLMTRDRQNGAQSQFFDKVVRIEIETLYLDVMTEYWIQLVNSLVK